MYLSFFFFNDTATTEIYTLSLHDALPILKCTPNGFTQKWSGRSGSRAVMCPVTPSSKPNFENKRNAAASRSLRCRRSSSTVVNPFGVHFSQIRVSDLMLVNTNLAEVHAER